MKKLFSIIFASLCIIFFFSCEIGLGEAVDTMPPEVSIISPAVESIIRDSFLVHGTWKDDGEIDSVLLTLTRTDGSGKSYGPFPATVINNENKEGTWNCVINPIPEGGERIIDGTYEVEVAITDKGEHTSTLIRQISIDNTAPLLILQRPVTDISVDDANTYEYGQLFTLEGQVSDESNVHHIDIDVYDDAEFTIHKKTITVDNVSSTINIDIAKFSEGDAYTSIYGYTSIEAAEAAGQLSAVRYCKITTYDNAKRYPIEGNESADDSRGNCTSEFYVYDDVNTADLLGKYKITELYKMKNGTYYITDTTRAAETVGVVENLLQKRKGASKFRLNPKNNPIFSVFGRPTTISNNSNIVLEVKPGLDGYVLQKDSLRPYIIACDSNGTLITENIPANRIYLSEAGACEKSGSNYKFTVELQQGQTASNYETTHSESNMLLVNHYYLFGFEGSDIKNKPIMSDGVTVFKFESNENSNKLNASVKTNKADWALMNGNDLYIKNDSIIYVKGEAVGVDANISSLISVKLNGTSDHVTLTVNEAERTMAGGYYTQPFSATINISEFTFASGANYNLVVSAGTPISDLTSVAKFDNEPPVIIFGTPSPYEPIHKDDWEWEAGTIDAEKAKRYLNKIATVNIGISDNDSVDKATVEFQKQIVDEGGNKIFQTVPELTRSTTENFSSWDVSFDTEKLEDNSLMRMIVTATDRSENVGTATSATYNVNQESDKPNAVSEDVSVCLKSNPTDDEKNKRSPGGSLSIILYDDDGVKTVVAELFKDDIPQEDKTQILTIPDSEIKNKYYYTYKVDKTLNSGTYTLKLTLTDKNGGTNEKAAFPIKITAPDPIVTIMPQVNKVTTSEVSKVIDPVREVENKIKVVSTGSPFKLERSFDGENFTPFTPVGFSATTDNYYDGTPNSETHEFTDIFTPENTPSGAYKVYYKVTDNDGKTEDGLHFGKNEAVFYIDNEAPSVVITDVPSVEATATPTGTIKGTAAETSNDEYQSKLRKIQYKIVGDSVSEIADAVETSSWNASVIYENHTALTNDNGATWKQGPKKLAVRAIDNVGNVSDWIEREFIFDRDKPEAEITEYIKKGEVNPSSFLEEENGKTFYYGYKFSLSGTAGDSYKLAGNSATNNSGTGCVKVYQNGTLIDTVDVTDGKWTVQNLPRNPDNTSKFAADDAVNEVAKDGHYEYYVEVYDAVGKHSQSSRIAMDVDHVAPTFNITDIGTISGTSKKFEIKDQTDGTGSGIAGVYYSFDRAVDNPISDSTLKADVETLGVIKFLGTGTEADGENLTEGKHKLYVSVIDKAGNRTDKDIDFTVDQGCPEVTLTSLVSGTNKPLIEKNGKTYLNASTGKTLKISGSVKESNKLKSFKITDSTATPNTIKDYIVSDSEDKEIPATLTKENNWTHSWSYTHSNIPEGTIKYQFIAEDIVAYKNNPTLEKEIVVDTVPPVVDSAKFALPNVNNTQEDFYTFTGSAGCITETGSGIEKIEIGFSDASATTPSEITAADKAEITFNSDGSWSTVIQFSLFTTFKTSGPKKIWIRATDNADNHSEWIPSAVWTYDTAVPETTFEITKDSEEVSELYRRKDYAIKGTATDDYGIQDITLIATDKDGTPKTLTLTKAPETLTKDSPAKTVEWEWKSTSGELSVDGEYTFTVTVKDWAELPDSTEASPKYKTVSTSEKITVDTQVPKITSIVTTNTKTGDRPQKFDFSSGEKAGQTWYNTKTIKLKVTPSADITGIASLSYSTTRSDSWIDLVSGTDNGTLIYTGTVQVENEGANTVYFRVKDNAGNIGHGDFSRTETFNIDTIAPSIGLVYDEFGNELKGEVYIDGQVEQNFDIFVDADSTEGNATTATGIKEISVGAVTAEKINDDTVNNGRYKISIPYENLETLSATGLNIVSKDYVNNSKSTTPFKLTVDSIAPEVTVKSPKLTNNETAALNGKITISADVSDYLTTTSKNAKRADGKLKKIEVKYSIDDKANWYQFDSTDSLTPTTAKESIEITHQFSEINKHLGVSDGKLVLVDDVMVDDVTETPAIQNVWIKIEATDQANHKTDTTIFKMIIDRNSDRPVIEFNNVTMGTDMSSTNYKWLSNTTLLQGTIEDDDGVEKLELSLTGADGSWKQANLTGTNWNFDIQKFYGDSNTKATERSANGPKTIYFKVTDKKEDGTTGNIFMSKADETTKAFDGIYLRHTESKNYSILYVKPETLAPVVEIKGAKVDGDANYSKNYSTMYLGGTKHGFSVQFTATDENGISTKDGDVTVTAKFTTDSGDSAGIEDITVNATGPDANGLYTATFATLKDSNNRELKNTNTAGTIEFTVSAKDTFEPTARESQTSAKIKYDYKFPEIVFSKPEETSVNVGSITAYGSITETAQIEYALSLSGTVELEPDGTTAVTTWVGTKADETGTSASGSANVIPAYETLSNMNSSWFLYFDGTSLTEPDHAKQLLQFIIDSGVTTDAARGSIPCTEEYIRGKTEGGTFKQFTDVVDVYLWIRATDLRGNVSSAAHKIQVDSQGERPEASISYPATATETVANTVNIYGSAKPAENNEIKYVWLQLVSSTHDANIGTEAVPNTFTQATGRNYGTIKEDSKNMTVGIADLDYMAWAGFDVYNMKTYTSRAEKWVAGTSTLASGYNPSDYGILIETNGSTGWSKKINYNGAFDSTSTNKVGIAVYAQDAKGHLSKRATQYINFDAAKPIISNVYLRNEDGSIVKEYKDNMWISGQWYLTFTATDNKEVKSVDIEGLTPEAGTPEKTTVGAGEGVTNNKWECRYKIPTTGTLNKNIIVSDGENSTPKSIIINIDSTAPKFDDTKDNFAKEVKNSNGYYSFGGTVKETESGIDYIAFYFARGNDVFDVMYKNTNETIATTNATDHLRWTESTISSAGANSITISDANKYAHRGGLVKVKGTIYKITSVNSTSITVDGNLETISDAANEKEKAYFAIANVVDNTVKETAGGTKETNSSNYAYGYGTPSLDDGDRMIEYLEKDGTWTAQINARNIPDGAIKLYCVAFDKAGNASALKEKDLYISNNPPRIAGVTINTDLNGNDKFKEGDEWESGEHITRYDAANISSGSVTSGTGENKVYDADENAAGKSVKNPLAKVFTVGKASEGFTIFKGRTEIIPEIVGGNGAVTYDFSWKDKAGGTGATEKLSGTNCGTVIATGSTDYTAKTGTAINIQVGDLVTVGDTVKTGSTPEAPHLLTITFRDSTKSDTNTTDDDKLYQSAELKMYFGVDVIAEGTPTVGINPFYWQSATENSVYDSVTQKLTGHIELPGELPVTFTSGSTDSLRDRDAKVSGQILVEGTASDSGKITELWFHIDGMTLTGDGEQKKGKDGLLYTRLAVDEDNVLTSKDSNLTLTNSYEAEQHSVTWTYKWNTENIDNKAATNVAVKVMAVNQGTPTINTIASGAAGYDTAKVGIGGARYAAPVYEGIPETYNIQVDVVPYITELVTSLSKANPDNSSEYGRSALGSYPVFNYTAGSTEKETVEVKGYNLKAGNDAVVLNNATANLTSADGKFTFELPEDAKSGNISVKVNNVESLNNENSNEAKGTYDPTKLSNKKKGTYTEYRNYYNRQPNNINNDNLTDNVRLDVWDLNATAVSVTSDLTRPVMHVNPSNGMVGFAYSNGQKFYIPDSTSSKVYWSIGWNAFNSIGFAYDPAGNTFAVEMGTDSYENGTTRAYSKFRFLSSLWGKVFRTNTEPDQPSDNNSCYTPYNALRLDSMGGNTTRFDSHPKLYATNSTSSGASNVYLMYYDYEYDELKLRVGTIARNNTFDRNLTPNGDEKYDQSSQISTVFGDFADDDYVWNKTGNSIASNYEHCSVVASKNVIDEANNKFHPGTEYSISVIPANTYNGVSTDILVMSWIDPVSHHVIYGYLVDPINNNHTNQDSTTHMTDQWHFTKILDGTAGGYCSITTDKAGGIHIAYYSTERNGSLKYTYIPTYNGTAQTCFVDTYGATGKNVTIDFAYDGSKYIYIPYIGYYNSMKKPKYAYLYDTASADTTENAPWKPKDGANTSDMTTGAWETMFVPTVSAVDATDGIQIGVYRNTNGTRKEIPAGTDGNVGGNTTDNPIIGYANGKSKFETAQLK